MIGQEVTEGRPFAHGHGQTCNIVVLPHGPGGAVSLNLVAAAFEPGLPLVLTMARGKAGFSSFCKDGCVFFC